MTAPVSYSSHEATQWNARARARGMEPLQEANHVVRYRAADPMCGCDVWWIGRYEQAPEPQPHTCPREVTL